MVPEYYKSISRKQTDIRAIAFAAILPFGDNI
jgi:hypothetical protein